MKIAMRKVLWILVLTLGLASTLRAQSSPVQYFYDDLGRLVKVVDQNGNFAAYNYDAVGNLLAITRSALPGNGGLAIRASHPNGVLWEPRSRFRDKGSAPRPVRTPCSSMAPLQGQELA